MHVISHSPLPNTMSISQDCVARHATPDFFPRGRPRFRGKGNSMPARAPIPFSGRTEAAFIDTIDSVSEPLSKMNSISPLVHLLTMAYQVDVPPRAHRDRLSILMHTMAAATPLPRSSHRYTIEEFRNSFINLLCPVLNGMAGLTEFCDAISTAGADDSDDFRDFWTINGRCLLREFVMGRCWGGASVRGMDIPFVDSFVRNPDLRIALGSRRDILALVPGDTKPGDDLELAVGATHTRIMRRTSDGCVELGEAFVQSV